MVCVCSLRGRDMSHLVCPLDILFSLPIDQMDESGQDGSNCAVQLIPRLRTIGIGDGGNEVLPLHVPISYLYPTSLATTILYLLLCVCLSICLTLFWFKYYPSLFIASKFILYSLHVYLCFSSMISMFTPTTIVPPYQLYTLL